MNAKKMNIMQIQEKFYESLKEKEKIYKELEEKNKNNNEEENIDLEFNYPYYIYQEMKKESDKKNTQEEKEIDELSEKKGIKNKNIQLIKTNVKYNILYEY